MVRSALLAGVAVALLSAASIRPAAAVPVSALSMPRGGAVENVHWVTRCYTQYGFYGPYRVCRQVYDPTPRYPRYPYPYPRYPQYPYPYY